MSMIDAINRLSQDVDHGIHLYSDFDAPPVYHSYDELHRRALGCIEEFESRGIARGTRVLLPFATSIDAIASLLALMGIGALTFSVRPVDGTHGSAARAGVEEIVRRHKVTHVVQTSGGSLNVSTIDVSPAGPSASNVKIGPARDEDIAFVQFSSGSTSAPKGIPVTYGALEEHLRKLVAFDERRRDDVYVSWLPLYHDLGLILGLLTSIYHQNDLHLASPSEFLRSPLGWLRLMSDRGATHTATPFFAVNHCLNQIERADKDPTCSWNFEKLRAFLIGSDPIENTRMLSFQKCLERRGFRRKALLPAYGMAEAVLVVSGTPLEKEPWAHALSDGRPLVSTGPLLPGFEARVTREDGSACSEGELGQIELRAGTMARGYFELPQTSFYNADGYFETGDLGYMIRGELFVAGRAGDRLKVNGQSLFASDFEYAVQTIPFVKPGRVVVFQIDSEIIVLAQCTDAKILEQAQEHKISISGAIARNLGVKIPADQVHFIAPGQIEKTSSGKLRRRAIAQSFMEGRLQYSSVRSPRIVQPAHGSLT